MTPTIALIVLCTRIVQQRYLFFVKLCFDNIMSIIMKVSYMKSNNYQYHIWCGFRTISLVKSVTSYTEYLMYFLCSEETRFLVSIFTYIDAMLLNLEAPVPQQTK